MDREELGREVRRIWREWAREQDNPKPSWLVPWEGLSEPDREVDRRIGEGLAGIGWRAAYQRVEALQAEVDRLREIEDAARAVFRHHVTLTPWPGQELPYPGPLRRLRDALGDDADAE